MVRPLPLQDPLEIWLGGIAPSELKRCGRLGDGWLPSFCTPEDVHDGIAVIEATAAEHDRKIDPEHFGALLPYCDGPIPESWWPASRSVGPGRPRPASSRPASTGCSR